MKKMEKKMEFSGFAAPEKKEEDYGKIELFKMF